MALMEPNGGKSTTINLHHSTIKLILAVISIISALGMASGWIYNRGGKEKEVQISISQAEDVGNEVRELQDYVADYDIFKDRVVHNEEVISSIKDDIADIKTTQKENSTHLYHILKAVEK